MKNSKAFPFLVAIYAKSHKLPQIYSWSLHVSETWMIPSLLPLLLPGQSLLQLLYAHQKQFVEIAHKNERSNEIKNYLSSEQYIKYGVQGSILGPILILIYINNLELSVKYVNPTFFADIYLWK